MNQRSTIPGNSLTYYRLITLWVVVEAFVGGIIHGFRIPVSGLVVGSCAVICVCLIGWYVPVKGAIIKATVIVAVFKMMLSPQAPLVAYIAVFFQGLLGELLFRNKKYYRAACFLLAVLALLESGLQRVLLLTLVYGNSLWKGINQFINGLTHQQVPVNYSLVLAGGYVALHFLTGLLIGWWASVLPGRLAQWRRDPQLTGNWPAAPAAVTVQPGSSLKKKRAKKALFVVWVVLVLLYVQSYFHIGAPLLPAHVSLKIMLRSMIIVLGWYFLARLLVKRWLGRWLDKKKSRAKAEIQQVWQLLPATQALIGQGWRQTADIRGWQRFTTCCKIILARALAPRERKVFILTGPVYTGKTSSLVNWSQKHRDVYGILTPDVEGQRVFMDAHSRQQFRMEAAGDETDILQVGRYVFSKQSFAAAAQVIRDGMPRPGWLVIDEVGPLELRGQGFHDVLQEALRQQPEEQTIVLVVREGLVEKVREVFDLEDAVAKNNFFNILSTKNPVL
jgi:nucleoside-triphosphatase THEP1